MSAVSLRHGVPLPASLTLAIKALAQVQLATAELDPALDPYDVAGKFLTRWMVKRMGATLDPKTLVYQSQKFKVRALRVIEAVEHLIGARPGQKLVVNFRANSLEDMVRRTGRRLALGLTAAASVLASGLTVIVDGCSRVGTDHIRGRRRSTDRWPGDRSAARTLKMTMVYDAVRSRDEDFVPLRLIERTTAFSSRYAMTVIARPTSQRSICRVKGPLGIVFVEALFIIRVSLLEGLRSATSHLLRVEQLTLPYAGRNIHHRLYS